MAEFTSVGYGIGEALNRVAENLTERRRLQFQERERQADAYERQAREIAANIAQLGGKDAPEARPYIGQLQEVLSKHNALYAPGETSTLVQRIGRFLGGHKGPQGQFAATPESVPGMAVTTMGELLPGQLDVRNRLQYAKPGPYTTQLSPQDEQQFQQWLQQNQDIVGIREWRDTPTSDYDLRGYWKSQRGQRPTAVNPNDQRIHFPDTFKTPYHQSFSNESQYATSDAPRWNDQDQLIDKNGRIIFDEKTGAAQQGESETISGPASVQRGFVPGGRLLPRRMQVSGPGARPPSQWLTPEEMIAAAPPRQNAILQELQDLRQAFKAGGQSEEEAGRNAIKSLNSKYGINLPGKPPRIERDPVSHDLISVTDEDTGTVYDSTNLESAPPNVQQVWRAAQRGQAARPEGDLPAVKTEFELFMRQYPNATVQDWAEFRAKEARKGKTRKEQIIEQIADAYEKGDRPAVGRLQSELIAIDPAGAERLQFASENLTLREVANVARQEAARTKRVAPLQAIVDTAENARKLKQMGDGGNGSADVDLTLEFFKTIRGAEGSGIRFSQNEQNFITGARSLGEALEVRGNQVFASGQPLATEQRQRMLNVIQMHAEAAKRRIDEIENEEVLTPQSLKERAKPKTSGTSASPKTDKESILEEINR